jgi:hypothetical protein
MSQNNTNNPCETEFDAWFTPLRFALLLCAFILAAFPGVILGDETFVARDFGLFSYPVALFQKNCFWQGELPLWNPYHNCGIPFLAQFNTLSLYPLSLFYLLLPLSWSLGVFSLLHLFIAGMGMYVLAREWTGRNFSACLAGVAFAFNGLSLNLLMWPSHIATYAWMPWVVWGIGLGLRHGGRMLLWGILFGSLQMLAGGPETILLTWMMAGALALVSLGTEGVKIAVITIRFFGMATMVAGACAIQLLPFLHLVANCQRDASYSTADWATPASGWANLFVPLFGCFLTRKGIYFQDLQYWTSSYFVGIAVLAMAAVAVWRVRSKKVGALAGMVILGLLLAAGKNCFLWPTLKSIFPFLAVMAHPVKFVFLVVFAVPLLAAMGVDELLQHIRPEGQKRVNKLITAVGVIFAITILLLIAWARAFPKDMEVWAVTLNNGLVRMAILLVSLALITAWRQTLGLKKRITLGVILLAVTWLDIRSHVPQQNPTARRFVFTPGVVSLNPLPVLGKSRAFVRPDATKKMLEGTSGNVGNDFLLYRQGLFLDSNQIDEIPTLWGFYSLYLRSDSEIQSVLTLPREQEPTGLLDFMGVCQATDAKDVFAFNPRTNFMPMFTVGQCPVFLETTNILMAMAGTDFQPRQFVYLEPEDKNIVTVSTNTEARIASEPHISPQRIELEVEAKQTSLVVASQTYDPAWQVVVNGKITTLLRANHGFTAFQIPAGSSHVTLQYVDKWLVRGAWISGVTILVAGTGLGFTRRKQSL